MGVRPVTVVGDRRRFQAKGLRRTGEISPQETGLGDGEAHDSGQDLDDAVGQDWTNVKSRRSVQDAA
jgi:hypothetical protein